MEAHGICRLPLSSDDDNADSPEPKRSFSKKRNKPKSKGNIPLKAKHISRPSEPRKPKKRRQTSECIDIPQAILNSLHEQLQEHNQVALSQKYGFIQGAIVTIPECDDAERKEYANWLSKLGFRPISSTQSAIYRIANTEAVSLIAKLNDRVLSRNSKAHHEPTTHAIPNSLSPYKKMFQCYDQLRLETLSDAEHDRLLSTIRHEQIALAMEKILAEKTERKERSRVRRISKLERISGRRTSRLPIVSSVQEWGIREVVAMPIAVLKSIACHSYLSMSELSGMARVSHIWREYAIRAMAWRAADYDVQTKRKDMQLLYQTHPKGSHLADGAYKNVYKVFSTVHRRYEVFTVMDIDSIQSSGNEHIVRQEVAHSLLVSELVRRRFCPNLVEIYDIFLANESPSGEYWKSKDSSETATGDERADDQHLYQYIHMEYCDGGDLEHFMTLQEDECLPMESIAIPYFFQMVFALFCARERLHLRHCDVKLLNYFLCDMHRDRQERKSTSLVYAIDDMQFHLLLPVEYSYFVKLADYGSADSDKNNLGQLVSIDQFTTLENTPIEYLLGGDGAQQSFAGDMFSLGLAFLHLCTGSAPYEEILSDVQCPERLQRDLQALWKKRKFSVLQQVCSDDKENVLYHTLYRYLVLFGFPCTAFDYYTGNRSLVWAVLDKHLGSKPLTRATRARAKPTIAETSVKETYERDSQRYSIRYGSHATIARGRERLESIAGAMELLLHMTHFDPTQRPTMKTLLFHKVFQSLCAGEKLVTAADFVFDAYAKSKYWRSPCPDI